MFTLDLPAYNAPQSEYALNYSESVAIYNGKWIDIDEQLPPSGEKVLIYVADCNEIVTAYFILLGDGTYLFYCGLGYNYYFNEEDNITSWMPLPEKPKRGSSECCGSVICEVQND